jgi:hypothetical protein
VRFPSRCSQKQSSSVSGRIHDFGSEWKPDEIKETATRAVQEYLATLDDAAFGAASSVTPKFISRSDPAAQWTGAHKGHASFAYSDNYLIDTDHGVIVD